MANPAFDMPKFIENNKKLDEMKYRPSYYFDFEKGEFKTDAAGHVEKASGREAYIQWCMKVCMTERNTFLAYSNKIGVEMENAMQEADLGGVISAIERTITEALMVNKKTERVSNFQFIEGGPDVLYVYFEIWGKGIEPASFIIKSKGG